MIKSGYLAALVLLSVFSWSSSAGAEKDLVNLVKEVKDGVVFIGTYDFAGKPVGSGSGFFITTGGQVITNRHVLLGRPKAVVKTSDGRLYPIKEVLAVSKEHDLMRVALDLEHPLATRHLATSGPGPIKAVKVTSAPPQVGERVMIIGNPMGLQHSVSDGIVAALRSSGHYGRVIQHTAPMSPGSSGGPLFNMDGKVIGVCTFHKLGGQNLNFAVHISYVSTLQPLRMPLTQWGAETLQERLGKDKAREIAPKRPQPSGVSNH